MWTRNPYGTIIDAADSLEATGIPNGKQLYPSYWQHSASEDASAYTKTMLQYV